MSNRKLKEKLRPYFRGGMVGLACGDALGMPVETMTHEQILAATGGNGITDYVLPLQKRVHDTKDLKPGMWTDDTQLALVVALSLIRCKGFDIEDQAREHVKALEESAFGWGKTTTLAIEQIRDGIRKPTDPPPSGKGLGSGNGVAMKIAPMALFYTIWKNNKNFVRDVITLGRMTHSNYKAPLGAIIIGDAIAESIHEVRCPDLLSCTCLDRYPWPSPFYFDEEADEIKRGVRGQEKSFRVELPRAKQAAKVDAWALRHACSMGFGVVGTVCFAIGVVEMHRYNFETAVLEAVNGGGDADTNAAMVGAIVGARVGIDGIPKRWLDRLWKKDEIIETADALLDAALS